MSPASFIYFFTFSLRSPRSKRDVIGSCALIYMSTMHVLCTYGKWLHTPRQVRGGNRRALHKCTHLGFTSGRNTSQHECEDRIAQECQKCQKGGIEGGRLSGGGSNKQDIGTKPGCQERIWHPWRDDINEYWYETITKQWKKKRGGRCCRVCHLMQGLCPHVGCMMQIR